MSADVVRALAWMREHPQDAVRLDELARIAGSAPRTLETHFREQLGSSPLTWARRMRLVRARRSLEVAGQGHNVTYIAENCGFTQLGRFAVDYRRAFGESPSQTLHRARSGALHAVDDEAARLTWSSLPACFAVAPRPCERALSDLDRAAILAPDFALPRALAAWCRSQRAAQHFGGATANDLAEAIRLADEACNLAPADALTLTIASGAYALAHRIDVADRLIERAIALDPASPFAWLRRGWLSAYAGDTDAAHRELHAALHLMPLEPVRHLALIGIGFAHFAAARYDRALKWAKLGVEAVPECFWAERVVAAAAVHDGSREEGRRVVRRLLRKDPTLTVAIAEAAWPFPGPVATRLAEGLAVAGLPRA